MVMDILCVHKAERVRELAENAGCELLYLPPYSPDLNHRFLDHCRYRGPDQ